MSEKKTGRSDRKQTTQDSIPKKFPNTKFVKNEGDNKLSDVLKEFSNSFIDECGDYDGKKSILELSILVWNFCVVFKENAEKSKDFILFHANEGDDDEAQTAASLNRMLENLIARKNLLYKDDLRYVITYTIKKTKSGLQLEVAYNKEGQPL